MENCLFFLIIVWSLFEGYHVLSPSTNIANNIFFKKEIQKTSGNLIIDNAEYLKNSFVVSLFIVLGWLGSELLIKLIIHPQIKIVFFYFISTIFFIKTPKIELTHIRKGFSILLFGLSTIYACLKQQYFHQEAVFWVLLGIMGLIIFYAKDEENALIPIVGLLLSVLPHDIIIIFIALFLLNNNQYINNAKKYYIALTFILLIIFPFLNWEQDGWLIALMCWISAWQQYKPLENYPAYLIGTASLALFSYMPQLNIMHQTLVLLLSLTLLYLSQHYSKMALIAVFLNVGLLFSHQSSLIMAWIVLIFAMLTKYRKNNYHSILLSSALMAAFYLKNAQTINYFYFIIPLIGAAFLYVRNKEEQNIVAIYILLLTLFLSFIIGKNAYLWLYLFPVVLFILNWKIKEYFLPSFLLWVVLFSIKTLFLFAPSLLLLQKPLPHTYLLLVPIVFLQGIKNKYVETLIYFIGLCFLTSFLVLLNFNKQIIEVVGAYLLLLLSYLGIKRGYELMYLVLILAIFEIINLMIAPWIKNIYVGMPIFNYTSLLYLLPILVYPKFKNIKSTELLLYALLFIWITANIRLIFHEYLNLHQMSVEVEKYLYAFIWVYFCMVIIRYKNKQKNVIIKHEK